jgi:DNA anti-recombination protein RmuC
MMALLSGSLSWLVGKGAATFSIPALLLGVLLLGHQFIQQKEARLQAQATNICDESWKTATRQQERDAARQETLAMQSILQGERDINTKLAKDLGELNDQLEQARSAASDDPRCLSDGVLRSLDGPGQNGDPAKPAGSRNRFRKQ